MGYGYWDCVTAVGTKAIALVASASVNVNVASTFVKLPFVSGAGAGVAAAVVIVGAWLSDFTVNAVTAAFWLPAKSPNTFSANAIEIVRSASAVVVTPPSGIA